MLHEIRGGNLELINRLMERLYADPVFKNLMNLAYRKLGQKGKQEVNEEDVMQDAMQKLYERAKSKQLETDNRERLFGFLRLLVAEKARKYRRRGSAKRHGGDVRLMSLDQPLAEGSDAVDRNDLICDPESATPEEQADIREFIETLLQRCYEKLDNDEFVGKVIEALFDDHSVNQIVKDTASTRSHVTTTIDAIRSIAKEISGPDWQSIKDRFDGHK